MDQDDLTVLQTNNQGRAIPKQDCANVSHHSRWKMYASDVMRLGRESDEPQRSPIEAWNCEVELAIAVEVRLRAHAEST